MGQNHFLQFYVHNVPNEVKPAVFSRMITPSSEYHWKYLSTKDAAKGIPELGKGKDLKDDL